MWLRGPVRLPVQVVEIGADFELPFWGSPLQEGANARVRVSTFDGDFESDFPVVIERFTGGREFNFAIGEPRASIVIEVFDGEIRLRRR